METGLMRWILIALLLVGIGFAMGFETATNWIKAPVVEPVPEWYQKAIEAWKPPEISNLVAMEKEVIYSKPKSKILKNLKPTANLKKKSINLKDIKLGE
jgi:hypothetical protein